MDEFFGDSFGKTKPADVVRPRPAPVLPSHPEPRRQGRPTNEQSRVIAEERRQKAADTGVRARISAGVTDMTERGLDMAQLAELFGLTKEEVRRRLELCPKHRMIKNNQPAYLVHVAAPYLVMPHNFERLIKSMNPKDLPPDLNIAMIRARKMRREEAEEDGRLFRVEKVVGLLGRAISVFEEGHREFIEGIVRLDAPSEHVEKLEEALQNIMGNIHKSLTSLEEQSETTSVADDGWHEEPEDGDDGGDFADRDYGNDPRVGDEEDED